MSTRKHGETAAHLALKRLALLWAQENGYPIAALEVSLPKCRYRADVAAYRPQKNHCLGVTALFECKQSAPDLRRDDCRSATDPRTARTQSIGGGRFWRSICASTTRHCARARRFFPEWDAYDFAAIEHRGYARVTRALAALQRQLRDGRKFEKLARYGCANLFFLVLPDELLVREAETPLGWGLLVEQGGSLTTRRKPVWHESSADARLRVLQKIAAAGTRQLNRQLELTPVQPFSHRDRSAGGQKPPSAPAPSRPSPAITPP